LINAISAPIDLLELISSREMTHSRKRRVSDASTPGDATISRIIEMAWEDRTAFEAIEAQFGLNESAVIDLMRKHMKPSSFRMWRKRVSGRRTKHAVLRGAVFLRHRASNSRM
jgi:uncharacterized protein (TIGR03643 family)